MMLYSCTHMTTVGVKGLRQDFKVARLSDERICRGKVFQLLGEDTQKARAANEYLAQGGTARRWLVTLLDCRRRYRLLSSDQRLTAAAAGQTKLWFHKARSQWMARLDNKDDRRGWRMSFGHWKQLGYDPNNRLAHALSILATKRRHLLTKTATTSAQLFFPRSAVVTMATITHTWQCRSPPKNSPKQRYLVRCRYKISTVLVLHEATWPCIYSLSPKEQTTY